MPEEQRMDPRAMVRVIDEEANTPKDAEGAFDLGKSDYLEIKGNGTGRSVAVTAKNDNETGGIVPLVTNSPFILMRVTTTERNALVLGATQSALVYNTTENKLNLWNGTAWQAVTSA